ncbi:hypothetical protein [Akkermansia muciniphila]|uniref:hypothetical protein n=1 Tax=Akkermansia muciniphila TaxID=239935 RepID=UPI003F8DD850
MLRKPRPDSVIGSQLPPIIKDDVDTMLLSGESYRKVQQRLEEDGIKLSQEAIRRYYHSQILPARLARQNKTAEELNKISVEGVNEATMRAIRSAALDLAASPSCDPKALNILVGLILKAEQLAQDKRRLKILEAKAAQADAAKQVTQSTLTPEERDRKLRNIFGC